MDASNELPVEIYNYSMNLDIAKVIATAPLPYACEVVPTRRPMRTPRVSSISLNTLYGVMAAAAADAPLK